jgi:hypothetical protein
MLFSCLYEQTEETAETFAKLTRGFHVTRYKGRGVAGEFLSKPQLLVLVPRHLPYDIACCEQNHEVWGAFSVPLVLVTVLILRDSQGKLKLEIR